MVNGYHIFLKTKESTSVNKRIFFLSKCRFCSTTAIKMGLLSEWRSWIRPIVIFLYIAILLVALPLMIVEFQEQKVQIHLQAWFIGGIFTLMAIPISFWGILQHCIHYTQPLLQRHIIRFVESY